MLDLIKKRRSIREYTDEEISDEQVRALLEAAMAAPSASNRQPWEFVVVRREDLRRKLGEMKTWSYMCASAPVVELERSQSHAGQAERSQPKRG